MNTLSAHLSVGDVERNFIAGLPVDYCRPHHQTYACPLVFIPGMWCDSRVFREWLFAAGSAGSEAYALNVRPIPLTVLPQDGKGPSFDDYVGDVRRTLAQIGPSVLIGHSLGALIAMKMAAGNPELIRGTIFLTSAPPKGVRIPLRLRIRLLRLPYIKALLSGCQFELSESDRDRLLFSNVLRRSRHEFGKLLRPESGVVMREVCLKRVPVEWSRITCPRIVVGGSYDRLTPIEMQRQIAEKLRCELITIDFTGHMPMLESSSESVIDRIIYWVRRMIRK